MTQTASPELAINGAAPVSPEMIPFMSVGLSEADIAAANEVLASGMLRAASRCAALEEQFSAATDARTGLTCANGTCALQLAYEALLQPGDEVIVPAWTYIATASMLVARGCRVVFCDVLEDSYQIDPADVERRITPDTKAIACTHLYGTPVDIDAIQAIAAKHDLKVIYDAAQAHLATYRGRGVGAFGDAVTYSFYATKNLGTGEGGMVTVNDDDLARRIGLLRSHGESGKYLHESIGYNYRMNDITGAIGLSKLRELPAQTERRRAVAALYDQRIDAIDGVERPAPTPGTAPAWHLYTCRLDLDRLTCTRDQFVEALKAENVPSAVHYPRSLTRQPAFAAVVRANGGDEPATALRLAERVFCIPIHHGLTDAQVHTVADALDRVATAYRK